MLHLKDVAQAKNWVDSILTSGKSEIPKLEATTSFRTLIRFLSQGMFFVGPPPPAVFWGMQD